MAKDKKKFENEIVPGGENVCLQEMNLDNSNLVVQANDLIFARQQLLPTSAKLLRLCISQTVEGDDFFRPYTVSVPELANTLGVSKSNLYVELEGVCSSIIENPLSIKNGKDWIQIPWVEYCRYSDETKSVQIKLNRALNGMLLNLKRSGIYSTQYAVSNIIQFRSHYSIRIFEMLEAKMKLVKHRSGSDVVVLLSVQEIREACDCLDKYPVAGDLNLHVVKRAIKEISDKTSYNVTVDSVVKSGRTILSYNFMISPKF